MGRMLIVLMIAFNFFFFFFFQAEDGIRDKLVTGVQTCALPIHPPETLGLSPGGMSAVHLQACDFGSQPALSSIPSEPRAVSCAVWIDRIRFAGQGLQPVGGRLGQPGWSGVTSHSSGRADP